MKKNIVKTMLKAAATTAMVAAMFVGGNKMEAKAMTIEQFAEIVNTPVSEVKADPMWMECYYSGYHDDSIGTYEEMKAWVGSVENGTATATVAPTSTTAGVSILHSEMLDLVNADRAANGTAPLAWSEELANHSLTRVIEVLANFQSAEYLESEKNGEPTGIIAHSGSIYQENAMLDWSADTVEFANSCWIGSEGHHDVRVDVEYTQYACASYLDPVTGQECWIELFQ